MAALTGSQLQDLLCTQIFLLADMAADRFEADLRSDGLTISGFQILSAVRAAGAGAPQAEIAQRLGIAAASLSEALRALTARGMVAQDPYPGDKRAKRLHLTPKGSRALDRALRTLREIDADMVRGLSERRLVAARDALEACRANLELRD